MLITSERGGGLQINYSYCQNEHTHEPGGESHLGSHLPVHLDESLLADHARLIVGECVLEAVAEQEDERQGFAELVRPTHRTRSEHTTQFVQHPVLRRRQSLQMT